MALPPLAPVADLETRLGVEVGSLAGTDLARAEADLADASALVRSESLGVSWVDADGVTITAPDEVVAIAVRAAKRSYLNPEFLTSENLGGQYSYQRDQNATSITLSGAEVAVIRRAAQAAKRAASGSGWSGSGTVRTPSAYFDAALLPTWQEGRLPL